MTGGTETLLDASFLGRALELAWRAAGRTHPNPLVGALVVKESRIVAEGYHKRSGLAHAEILALDEAGRAAEGSTLYVTLEPCAHKGKTPPCVDRIISSGVRRVVACTQDPFPHVSGGGFEKLKSNRIQVDVGCLKEQALLLNLPYFMRHLGLGSIVTLKIASTMDGRIASVPGKRDAITGKEAQLYAHRLRASHDAVLIGVETLLTDRPLLDCRLLEDVDPPVPVVLDANLRFPEDYPWIKEGRAFFVCCGMNADASKVQQVEKTNGRVLRCKMEAEELDITNVVSTLEGEGVSSILVEGGGKVFSSFIDRNLWNAAYTFVSPLFFGEEGVAMYRKRFANKEPGAFPVDAFRVGDDFLLRMLNEKTRSELLEKLV
ncbi:MAG: bifunctional diaminohydroxyphosphoribosylaminopyrimidine deaminase/5-amino-6-(5-phosphoribosylamino)uracil reductase RibD [Candidatus Latescibacteria bacterium]|nr:bifunctional diaminohydroxyphosphoribosylaminopyrimidine deaminase/5-amino-6-(5-phosphoribosylamino)uracil reductase RibD [Candidatus Latescibacterota bacterium]NIM21106.1 bifunctional diaminohydroxyphosphoribosylaminopyrimidine deaminase/5-amino-6-(5-phosphoribosylamino)uracil reductase RibD [Candidatus Latescibacterota bacterium]NIM65241.1 bifunctional diaminohydroxyphosphoribosylaminopyrimidine deaminase/5-amino-6-(5-phosphoribosylamino)uracil reductase RibD [Candidatus Latescibacterota bac